MIQTLELQGYGKKRNWRRGKENAKVVTKHWRAPRGPKSAQNVLKMTRKKQSQNRMQMSYNRWKDFIV